MMSGLQVTSTAMQLLPLVCVSLMTWSGTTFGDGNGPAVINMVVYEDSDVVLPCSFSTTSIKQKLFDWKKDGLKEVFMYDEGELYNDSRAGQDEQFKGRVSHFPEQLEFGNASIIIRKTKVTDSGRYTCDFPFHQPVRRANIELVVDPILKDRTPENIPGVASKPNIVTLDQTKDWALLRCEVRGHSPEPEVEWQDRAGNVLPAEKTQVSDQGGRFDITLQTTVTKTGHYRCVATQKKIKHQIYTETLVHLDDGAAENQTGFPVGWVVAAVLAVLLLIVGVVLGVKRYKSQRRKKGKKEKETSGRALEERPLSQNGQTCNDVTYRCDVSSNPSI